MATCNSTLAPVEGLTNRASEELRAASDALYRTSVLLQAIEKEFMGGATVDGAELDVYALLKTALETSKTYAERAEGEADFFAVMTS